MGKQADPFRKLYDANHLRVRRLLARIVGPQDADDLAQTVFTKAAEALPSFRGEAQASTWLYRIAANVAADWLRGRAAHEAKVTVPLEAQDDAASEAKSISPEGPTSPEQELIRREMRDCIRGVIEQLPQAQRTALVLGELGGLSDEEIARTLGISRGNAKVRLHRARAQLKKALEVRCDFYRSEDNRLACEPKAPACASAPEPGCRGKVATDRPSPTRPL
jgi:RNA polymerase sigma-70 factor (ECF subfamily)